MPDRDDTRRGSGGDPLGNGDIHGTPDATLHGYLREHSRPPAFEGADGEPYTVSVEVQKTGNLPAQYEGYLVFPRWAATGLGVVGHVETDTLLTGATREQVEERLGDLSLVHVKLLLDRAIQGGGSPGASSAASGSPTSADDPSAEPDSSREPDDPSSAPGAE